jgi:hypothetical protein
VVYSEWNSRAVIGAELVLGNEYLPSSTPLIDVAMEFESGVLGRVQRVAKGG